VLHCETAIKTWIDLAAKAGCAQLFNCPVEAITHDDNGVTVTTIDGDYSASRLLVSAGTWVTRLLPDLPIQPVRKVFSWFQSDGRYSARINSRPSPANCPMAISSTVSRQKKTR
jgi:N-methyl-L-tryptophan oxidase